ncbi:hypothetical protein GCM10010872_21160 [Dyella flava]|nr:hypothetical protein GCM10010872_21160 [Dyella flava]
MKVYGRRKASKTIHMANLVAGPWGLVSRRTLGRLGSGRLPDTDEHLTIL